jgi:uncharacterized protein YjbI with pentapeptide repeats
MVAFLKSNHRPRNDDRRLREIVLLMKTGGPAVLCGSSVAPPWPDTQAALSVLLGLPRAVRSQVDLSGVDLIGVRMDRANFSGVVLRDATLAGAKLSGANFDHAQIPSGTDLRGACLRGARFNGAHIGHVQADGSNLSGADLANSDVFQGQLDGAVTDACTRLPWARDVPAHCDAP